MPKWEELVPNETWNLQLILKKWRSDSDNRFVFRPKSKRRKERTEEAKYIMIILSKFSLLALLNLEMSFDLNILLIHFLPTQRKERKELWRKKFHNSYLIHASFPTFALELTSVVFFVFAFFYPFILMFDKLLYYCYNNLSCSFRPLITRTHFFVLFCFVFVFICRPKKISL